jgi:hypothetical protein
MLRYTSTQARGGDGNSFAESAKQHFQTTDRQELLEDVLTTEQRAQTLKGVKSPSALGSRPWVKRFLKRPATQMQHQNWRSFKKLHHLRAVEDSVFSSVQRQRLALKLREPKRLPRQTRLQDLQDFAVPDAGDESRYSATLVQDTKNQS